MGDNQDTWPAGMTATMNVTYTQANAAGGAIVCEITPGAGNEFFAVLGVAINSGTNGIQMGIETVAGGAVLQLVTSIASGAGTKGYLGSVTTAAPATLAIPYPGIIVSGTQAFKINQTAAGAQNDTFQIILNIRLKTGQVPTVTHANSTNPANVTVTAGAEAFTTL